MPRVISTCETSKLQCTGSGIEREKKFRKKIIIFKKSDMVKIGSGHYRHTPPGGHVDGVSSCGKKKFSTSKVAYSRSSPGMKGWLSYWRPPEVTLQHRNCLCKVTKMAIFTTLWNTVVINSKGLKIARTCPVATFRWLKRVVRAEYKRFEPSSACRTRLFTEIEPF